MRRFAAGLTVVLLVVSGCSAVRAQKALVVMAAWASGPERATVEKVLAAFTRDTGIRTEFVGTRAITQVLQSDVRKGTPPDVAILPSPGDLAGYARAGALTPLDAVFPARVVAVGEQWSQLEQVGTPDRFGVAVKVDLKSALWYDPSRLAKPPRTAAELRAFGRSRPEAWCLGLAGVPASGWPGTDWVEDILLHQAGPEVYRAWTAGTLAWTDPRVRAAWETWGELIGGAVSGGPGTALLTDYDDAGRGLFSTPPSCSLDHQASFITGAYVEYLNGHSYAFTRFPPLADVAPASVVSADLAAIFRDSPQARRLVEFLASDTAQGLWAQDGAYSASRTLPGSAGRTGTRAEVTGILTSDDALCFDGADLMPATMRTAFYRAVLRFVDEPGTLDTLLAQLDTVRTGAGEKTWLDVPCG
ncbi:ABC transporter substrate-binding protein [Actinokineospora sp. PR83]|uniref:ABC transporter substrate-binding protein n=1 Tax=Actinokineospora sp. PR83 TaxID=2884908 RepID=UPI0027DF20D8|nr:ABC transporter substrate-binding protein [Actinokineospora sp. PR83]MCG8915699.1 ABC transporter substrate-binding protein [Actinokineospora sp. PR83]